MKGRKPKPTKRHLLEKPKLYGELKEREEIEPKPQKQIKPRIPAYFSDEHRKEWRRLAAKLKNYNLYIALNETLMEVFVLNLIDLRNWFDRPADNKSMNDRKKYTDALLKTISLLGLSSTDMAKLGSLMVSAQKKKNEMEGLLD